MQLTRTIRLAVASLLLLTMTAGPASARTLVDPTTLNPAPPDFFNAVCTENGANIICALAFTDPEIVEFLATLGLRPGVRVEVREKHPFDGPLVLRVDGKDRTLGEKVAHHIYVKKDPELMETIDMEDSPA